VPTTATATTAAPTAAPNSSSVTLGTPDVFVTALCKQELPGVNNSGQCLAVFTYDNPTGDPVSVPVGTNNDISPGPAGDSWPTTFAAGLWYGAVAHEVPCSEEVTWTLRTGSGVSTASTSAGETACGPLPL
jgi:hypothetical protein